MQGNSNMQFNNMTLYDWEKYLSEWRESLFGDLDNNSPFPKIDPKPNHETKCIEFIYEKGRGTRKARFFVTSNSNLSGKYGFWCPKSCILSVSEDYEGKQWLEVKDWFTPKEIEYND